MRAIRQRILTLVAGFAGLSVVLAGCGGSEPTATSSPRPTATPAPTATASPAPTPTPVAGVPTPIVKPGKRGGTLVVRSTFDIFEWDNYDVRNQSEWRFNNLMFNSLVSSDPNNFTALVGDLAETWTISQNGTEYVFKLRKAAWHDARPVTAADIVYNLQRARAINANPPTTTALTANVRGIVDVRAIDPATVRITLARPAASFLGRLSIARFVMYPSHLPFPEQKDAWVKNPVGSGPFKLKENRLGERTEWVRNDGYFKEGLPYLDGVLYHVITDAAKDASTAAWRAGKFMADGGGDGTSITPIREALKKDLGFVHLVATAGRAELHLNNKPPWSDPRVRQALMIGFDRQSVFDGWLKGAGTTMASPVLPPERGGAWGLPASELGKRPGFPTAREADIAKAKELLKEAGVNPAAITVRYIDLQAFAQQGGPESIAAAIGKLGFKVDLQIPSTADRTSKLRAGDFDMFHDVKSIQFDDPLDTGGMISVITGDPTNFGKWSDPAFDRLAEEQEGVVDATKRKALVYQLQQRYLDDAFAIPIVYRDYDHGALPYVRNYPNFPFTQAPRYRWEQVWLDKA